MSKQSQNPKEQKQFQKQLKPNLFSKIKLWCYFHKVPFTAITIALCSVVAFIVLAVGGAIAGWNIFAILTSDVAWLIYAILAVLIIVLVFRHIFDKDKR